MLFEEIMFEPSQLMHYRIYDYLLHSKSDSLVISKVADHLGMRPQQLVRELSEVNKELKKINTAHESFILGAGKIEVKSLSITRDEFRYCLLEKSIAFQYLLYVVEDRENASIEDFCTRYGISRSSVSRKIKGLRNYLKQYGLRLTYQEANIVGEEHIIRLALFNLFWAATKGIKLPFDIETDQLSIFVDTYQEYFSLSRTFLGRKEIKLLFAVILKRMRHQHFVKYQKEYDFLLKDNPYYDLSKMRSIFPELAFSQSFAESSFVYFLSHSAPFFTSLEDPLLDQTIVQFQKRKNVVDELVESFLRFAKSTIFVTKSHLLDSPLIKGNLLNITYAYYVLKQSYPNLEQLMVPKNSKNDRPQKKLESKISQFFSEYRKQQPTAFLRSTTPYIVQAFSHLLLPYYEKITDAYLLKVGVVIEHNEFFARWVYQFLEDLNFVVAESYDEQSKSQYDIIISSVTMLSNDESVLPIYIWDYETEETQLGELYYHLRLLYEKKVINQ